MRKWEPWDLKLVQDHSAYKGQWQRENPGSDSNGPWPYLHTMGLPAEFVHFTYAVQRVVGCPWCVGVDVWR